MTPALDLLKKVRAEHRVHSYEHDPKAASYGLEAAEKLGLVFDDQDPEGHRGSSGRASERRIVRCPAPGGHSASALCRGHLQWSWCR